MLQKYPIVTTIGIKSLKNARGFYEGTLGLKASDDSDENHVTYEFGGGTSLYMYESSYEPGGTTRAGIDVDDLDSEMAELRKKGLKFEEYDFPGLKTENGVATWGPMRTAWFKDPDGNIIALNEIKK